MYREHSILALIPARGGSKAIPRKNIRLAAGKPLIAYTILAARESQCFDSVIVSTDDHEIASVAIQWGAEVPFARPSALAEDTTKTEDVVIDALTTLAAKGREYDLVVLLQPTSPLRSAQSIRESVDWFIKNNVESLLSVSPVDVNPLHMRSMEANGKLVRLVPRPSDVRRQDMPKYYRLNGAIYINRCRDVLAGCRLNDNEYGYLMSSEAGLEIDEPEDWPRLEQALHEKAAGPPKRR